MSAQTTLFDPPAPMVRHSDPSTSRLAAMSVDVKAGQAKVLRALADLVTATDQQIESHPLCCGMGRGSAIKRRLELQRKPDRKTGRVAGPPLVEECGVTGPPRRLRVWRLTAAGREALAKLEAA